jgi:hypothetical protein
MGLTEWTLLTTFVISPQLSSEVRIRDQPNHTITCFYAVVFIAGSCFGCQNYDVGGGGSRADNSAT